MKTPFSPHQSTLQNASGMLLLRKPLRVLFLCAAMLCSFSSLWAQTPVPMASQPSLTYTENFDSIATWANAFASGVGANRFSTVPTAPTGTIPSATVITTSGATFVTGSSGGLQKGAGTLNFLSTGATNNTTAIAADLLLDFATVNAGNLSFDAATVFNSTGNRNGNLRVYASVDNTNWTELISTNLPYVATNNVAGSASISVALPSSFNLSSTARLRFYYHNATGGTTGSRPKISVDNIVVTAIDPNAAPTVTSNSATGTVDVPFSYFISATNAPTSYNATGLPAGLSINTTTGEISGTPSTAITAASIGISATNGIGTGNGTLTLTINKGSQTINFGALSPVTFGGSTFTLSATGGASGNPITYVSSDPGIASIVGNVVTINGAGMTTITASQAGNADYEAATDVSQVLIVNQATQTITFNALPVKLTTDAPFVLNATGGGSGNAITYVSSNTSVITISGNIATIVGAGTTTITASQAGNANYLPATNVSQNQIVNTAGLTPQTITFNPLPTVIYGQTPIALTATGGASGNPVTYTSSDPLVATISGNIMTIVGPGSTTITASQAGNASYQPAVPVDRVQVVNPKALTVPGASVFNKTYDGTTTATLFNLTLSGVEGADVVSATGDGTFASANVGTGISVTTNLTLTGADAFKYTLTQPTGLVGDITPASQTITFNPILTKTYTSAPFTLVATGGGSTSPIVFVSDNPLVATVSGNTVTIVGVGTANITASQAADANHAAASDVVQVLIVNQATQFITFATLANKILGDAPFNLTATASSSLAVTYTSSNPAVATVSGNTVTIVGIGSTNIVASQVGDVNFLSATDVTRVLTVTYPLIAAWDFFGQSSPATFAATLFNSNLIAASGANLVTRGDSALANTAGNSFRTTGFKNNGIATTNQDYFQTTLTAAPGHSLSLYSINANFAGTTSFAATPGVTSQFAYSLDGVNFTLINSPFVTVGSPASSPLVDVTAISDLQNVHASKTVTIRYYASGQTSTGGWGFNSPAVGTNGLAFGGNLAVCVPVSNSSNLTICASALPYTWNGQTITAAGTYTHTAINVLGCDSIETLVLTVNSCAGTTLNLNCFIEGYWDGTSAMAPVLANQGLANPVTDCDSILVELHDENAPHGVLYATVAVLQTNGTATCTFATSVTPGNYYVVVKHRNALQTWSAAPVAIGVSGGSYNFTTAQTQAYGSASQVQVSPGVWAIYSGDVVADENMDLLDIGAVETDASSFLFGYYATDLTGDGNVDLLDTPIVEINAGNFIFSQHP